MNTIVYLLNCFIRIIPILERKQCKFNIGLLVILMFNNILPHTVSSYYCTNASKMKISSLTLKDIYCCYFYKSSKILGPLLSTKFSETVAGFFLHTPGFSQIDNSKEQQGGFFFGGEMQPCNSVDTQLSFAAWSFTGSQVFLQNV